jgi:hypothetical protein
MKAVLTAVLSDLARFALDELSPSAKRKFVQKSSSLHPRFETRRQYYASNPETLKLRLLLSSYDKNKLGKPVSALEFILYRLMDLHLDISSIEKFSGAGFLHESVKGLPGVHVSIKPTRHAIMEIFDEYQKPKLLFVENIFGDESIEVESVGLHVLGEFRYDVFTKKEWQEWRPVFISFNQSV